MRSILSLIIVSCAAFLIGAAYIGNGAYSTYSTVQPCISPAPFALDPTYVGNGTSSFYIGNGPYSGYPNNPVLCVTPVPAWYLGTPNPNPTQVSATPQGFGVIQQGQSLRAASISDPNATSQTLIEGQMYGVSAQS